MVLFFQLRIQKLPVPLDHFSTSIKNIFQFPETIIHQKCNKNDSENDFFVISETREKRTSGIRTVVKLAAKMLNNR